MNRFMTRNRWRLVVVGGLLLVPVQGRAQSAVTGTIAGVVKDATNAVLPGVTVEAASPALIEKVRTVVTDSQGEYKIVELRPGPYTVTFSLPGFSTVRREGLELTTGFTASVDAELRVGGVEETITVTGASPVVDTQNVRTQNVLSRDILDTLPTGKTVYAWAALTLGMRTIGGGADVGGSQGEEAVSIAIHGGRSADQHLFMDGMSYNNPLGQGGGFNRIMMPNQLMIQEITLGTSGQNAESEGGGVQVNLVPKDGGNSVRGSFVSVYTNSHLQSGNLDDALRARGLTLEPKTKRIYDYGMAVGGPIKRDRMWFFTAHRWWGAQSFAPGNYFNATLHTLFYTPDLSRPAFSDVWNRDNSVRITWQAAAKHKITLSESFQRNCTCYIRVNNNVAPEATAQEFYSPVSLTQATWSSPRTSRLLLQAGATYLYNALWHGNDRSTLHDIPITELSTGFVYGSSGGFPDASGPNGGASLGNQWNGHFTVSYITGSHALKTGVFWLSGIDQNSTRRNDTPISYAFRKPTPDAAPLPVSVTYFSSLNHSRQEITKFAGYVQDQWTIRRLTLNLGVRLDTFRGKSPAQSQPASLFVPALSSAEVSDVPNWKDIAPRLGAAYNLFGNGKTAIKGSVGRYVQTEGAGFTRLANPLNLIVTSATRVWNDVNGDYIPQDTELGPLSNAAFGTVGIHTRIGDDVRTGWGVRPYNWLASAALQHELRPGLALTAAYFRRWYGNFRVTDNLSVRPSDYDPYCVTAPINALLPGGGGNQVCGYYDIKPTAFGAVENVLTQAAHFGKRTEVYNGLEFSVNGRFGKGGTVSGGVSTGRTTTDNCFVVDSPQQAQPGFCHVTYPFKNQTELKVSGVYPLPWDLQASAVFQNLAGIPRTGVPLNQGQGLYGDPIGGGVYAARNAEIAPSLGRDLSACGGRVPCTATTTINLVPAYGGGFEDRLTQLDLRLTKIIRVRQFRIQGTVDAYNIFNANTILGVVTQVGPNSLRPTVSLGGRLLKFGVQVDF